MGQSIAIIANCQVASYARCLKAYARDAEIVPIPLARATTPDACEELAERAAGADFVFTQPVDLPGLGPLNTEALRPRCRKVQLVPCIGFGGFHPDAVHLMDRGRLVWSPTAPFHSRLAIGAFLAGASVERALSLYNALIFDRLGYFTAFDSATALLQAHMETVGYDLASQMSAWLAHGAFMHAPNHPKLATVGSVVLEAADQAGLPVDRAPRLEMVVDPLGRAAGWPVYPAIARRLGIEADEMFRCGEKRQGADLTLPDFVQQSFDLYQTVDRATLDAAISGRVRKLFKDLEL